MKIPLEIRIGSCDYSRNYTKENIVLNNKACYASIDYENHSILIDDKKGDRQQHELSFLHELFHGIVKERNIEVENEELIVEELARGLHQVIRDNPDIFKESGNV
jgi:hypothetical protein